MARRQLLKSLGTIAITGILSGGFVVPEQTVGVSALGYESAIESSTNGTQFELLQRKDTVEHLGADKYHDRKGHNTLTARVSGSNLERAWVEVALGDGQFSAMQQFTRNDLLQPLTESPSGTAIDGISLREAFDTRYRTAEQDTITIVWGEDGTPGDTLFWGEAPDADPTSFENTRSVDIRDTDDPRMEDPNLFYDENTETLYLLYETSSTADGKVGVYEADSLAGKSYSNPRLLGGDEWPLDVTFGSPNVWRYNDDLFLSGEELDSEGRNLMIAKGEDPTNYTDYVIAATTADHDVYSHVNIQSRYIDRYGTFHAYSNQEVSEGEWASRHMWTDSYDDNYPVEPWTMSDQMTSEYTVANIFRPFNELYVYGIEDSSAIVYWDGLGTRIEESLSPGGGTVSFEYYEPNAPPNSTVRWRLAVEEANDNVLRSAVLSFRTGPQAGGGG